MLTRLVAVRFEKQAREYLIEGNYEPLINFESVVIRGSPPDVGLLPVFARDALLLRRRRSLFALLYVIALRREGEQVTFLLKDSMAARSRCSPYRSGEESAIRASALTSCQRSCRFS